MGQKGSKNDQNKDKIAPTSVKQPVTVSNNEPEEEADIHPSWNDDVLFTNKNGEKVTKDDFELLTVIGKGSFGKV